MRELLDDTGTDATIAHMRECEDLDCPLCPFDDEPELNPYEQAKTLARFAHEDAAADQCH